MQRTGRNPRYHLNSPILFKTDLTDARHAVTPKPCNGGVRNALPSPGFRTLGSRNVFRGKVLCRLAPSGGLSEK